MCGIQVACGSGLELIYEFLLTDELANRPDLLRSSKPKVRGGTMASWYQIGLIICPPHPLICPSDRGRDQRVSVGQE